MMHQMTRLPNLALTREGLSQAVVGLTAVLSIMAAGGAAPKTATIIPAPREMRVTGGEYVAEKPPTLEKVDGIPREGYEISITTNGITIRRLRKSSGRILIRRSATSRSSPCVRRNIAAAS